MFTFNPVEGCKYKNDYEKICSQLNETYEKSDWASAVKIIRRYVLDDIFFLIYFVGGIREVNHPFLVECIKEYENVETKSLDLWFRNGYKSTIITVYGMIQELLRRPTIAAIASHTGSVAKNFLRRIKNEFENNGLLKAAFYDIIPENPLNTKGIQWDLDKGLQLLNNGKFGSSVMAFGLDSMPTGLHFDYIVYDDVCVKDNVTTSVQRQKNIEDYELSHGLLTKNARFRVVGTRYHYADLYDYMIKQGDYIVRVKPITHNGNFPYKPETAKDNVEPLGNGEAIFYDQEYAWQRFKEMGKDVFSTQMLLNPTKADERTFDIKWLNYYNKAPATRNIILVDPASSQKQESSYTVMWVIGIGARGYYYIKDCVRDRLTLSQKKDALFNLVEKWDVKRVYYERYSMQADIEYIREKQSDEGFYFKIEEVGGTKLSKDERIMLLQPLLQEGRLVFPKQIIYYDINGKKHDLIQEFIEDEYRDFPLCSTKDMLDALARLLDNKVKKYSHRQEQADNDKKMVDKLMPLRDNNYNSKYGWMLQ